MAKCSYCGKQIEKGTGKIFVKKDGKILNFHNSKCEKNMLKLKRKARNFKWTTFFEKTPVPSPSEKKAIKKKAREEKKKSEPQKEIVKKKTVKKSTKK